MYMLLQKNAQESDDDFSVQQLSYDSYEEMLELAEKFKHTAVSHYERMRNMPSHILSEKDHGLDVAVAGESILLYTRAAGKEKNLGIISSIGSAVVKELASALKKKLVDEFRKSDTYRDSQFFQKIFPEENDVIISRQLEQISADVKEILKKIDNIEHRSLEALFIQNRAWLRTEYANGMQAYREELRLGVRHNREGQVNFIKDVFKNLDARNTELRNLLTNLEYVLTDDSLAACEFYTRLRVMLYANSCMLNLVFLREQLFWASELEYNFGDTSLSVVAKAKSKDLNLFVKNYLDRVQAYKEKLTKGRYGKISDQVEIRSRSEQHSTTIDGRTFYNTYWWIKGSWHDNFSSDYNNDPFKGQTIYQEREVGAKSANDQDRIKQVTDALLPALTEHRNNVQKRVTEEITGPLDEVISGLQEFDNNTYNPNYITGFFRDVWKNGGDFANPLQPRSPNFFANTIASDYTFFFSDLRAKELCINSGLYKSVLFTTSYDDLSVVFDAALKSFVVTERKIVGWKESHSMGHTFKYPVYEVVAEKKYPFAAKTAGVYEFKKGKTIIIAEEIMADGQVADVRLYIGFDK